MKKYINNYLKNPNFFLFFAIVSSAILLMLVGTHTYNVMEDVLENSKQAQIERNDIKDIPFLDEVLTNSALLAATTGDAQWEQRYRLFEPKLDQVIKYLIRLDTLNNLHKMLKLTDNANVSLVAMENRVFELVRDRKLDEAVTIMKGSEYARQKAFYSEGLTTFIKLHELETDKLQTRLRNSAKNSKWFFGLVILLLVIVWLPIERFLRKSRVQMLQQNQELELQIQARKESESKLHESQKQTEKVYEQLQESIKASGVGLWDWNMQTNEVYQSPEWKKQIGYEDDELQGSVEIYMSHLHPDDAKRIEEATKEFISGKRDKFESEYRFRHKDGSYRWILARGSIQFGDNGKPLHLLGSHLDITERKKTEEKINMLAHAVKNSADCIAITDKDYQIIFVNDSFCKVYGYKEEEIVGQPISIIHSEHNLPEVSNDLFSTLAKKEMWTGEVLNKRKVGIDFPVQLSLAPLLNDKGELIAVVGVTRDITERKSAEAEIKKTNAALTKLNAEKDKFFSIIAHDLKPPFNAIVGFSEILDEQVKENNYQGIEEYTGIILHSSQRAMDLLMNLMEWSRSQTGKMEFNPAYFQMTELINEVELLLDNAAGQKSITITKTLPNNVPVFADKNMMSTVLRNLISNAIKFTHPGGWIIISAEEKEGLTVSVIDNGVGIPKDRIEQLFRIDENYSTYGTQNERGTGLGLILCKEFIEKHGGKIWVESEEGKGSIFYFTIP